MNVQSGGLSFVRQIVASPVPVAVGAVKHETPVTFRVSLAVPLLPDDEVRSPLVLTKAPTALPITSTDMVQVAPAPTLPLVKLITPVSAVAVTVPPQVLAVTEGVATTTPAGKLSVNARLLAATAEAELSTVKVKVLVDPRPTDIGAKTLANVGGGSITRSAVAGTAT